MALTRDRIVDAAIKLIERDGLDAVSMRKLAAELDAGTMSLYNHIPNKAALLDAVSERIFAELDTPAGSGDWRDRLRAQAHALRDLSRRYPHAFVLLALRRLGTESGLRPVERALATLADAGYHGDEAVHALRAIVAYITGALMREAETTPALGGVPISPYASPIDATEYPLVAAASPTLAGYDHALEFDQGLDLLIQALATRGS
ncbi:TetR/AcrR family transcriptional regulator C-terminal domain-containing protein [Amycolatopsis sp. cg5]|uniref:TetR/AcrR family transcriptional regulator C-terminal domain-containing protein n=1 Tax=Amycolatopsis sp. cg5 TaxID=3238802 RepID=UPI00352490B2